MTLGEQWWSLCSYSVWWPQWPRPITRITTTITWAIPPPAVASSSTRWPTNCQGRLHFSGSSKSFPGMVTSSILSVLQARIIDKICGFFLQKTKVSVCCSWPPWTWTHLVRYAGGCLCITVIPKEMNKASLRALEGTRVCPKSPSRVKDLNKQESCWEGSD